MNKILGIGLWLVACASASGEEPPTFNKVQGIEETRIRRVAISQHNPSFVAVAAENALYLSKDNGKHFQKTVVLKDEKINHLFIDSNPDYTIYLAATRHCYMVGEKTKRIFSGDDEKEINFILKHKGRIYVATSAGLHYADASLLNWQTLPSLRDSAVHAMESFGDNLYLACDSGAYLYRPDGTLRRLFATRSNNEGEGLTPWLIKVDTLNFSRLWLGTNKGVYCSNDKGESWQKLHITNVDNVAVHCLVQPPLAGNCFYICTDAGLFKVDVVKATSQLLYKGIPTSATQWMDFTTSGNIYLATDQGLFKSGNTATPPSSQIGLQEIMKGEPSIREVQEAALRYNSVHPEKVGQWRKRIKYRALLPRLSVDYDKTIGSSFTQGGYYYAEGPYDWGVSLTWDLDELIWNSYEDDIDNRNKLTTQLRMDLLDDVNRLYFERLRLKRETSATDPHTEETIQKELRLQELTATLDGYTGGYFSKNRIDAL